MRVEKVTEKLGIHTSNTCDLAFDDARVPADALLGSGRRRLRQRADDAAVGTDRNRGAGGRHPRGVPRRVGRSSPRNAIAFGRPIGAFEGISFKIAQMATDLDAARLLIYRAAALRRRREAVRARGEQGEALRFDRGAQTRRRSVADSRRLRLHDRVPGRALLPRREDHRDLRRNVGDPAADHRPLVIGETRLTVNLMEYQGKELFRRAGIPVPRSQHAHSAHDVAEFVERAVGEWVVKAQVLMGGRGKAGKIKFAATADEGRRVAEEILATPMPPNRQNPAGEPIKSLLVEEKLPIEKEAYCAIAIDRAAKKPVIMVSRFGGMDIEEVSEKHPESIAKFYVDTAIGYSPFIGRELAFEAQLDPGFPQAVSGDRWVAVRPVLPLRRQAGRNQPAGADRGRARLRLRRQGRTRRRRALSHTPSSRSGSRRCRSTKTRSSRPPSGLGIRNFRRLRRRRSERWPTAPASRWRRWTRSTIAGGAVANFLDVGGGANAERVRSCYELVVNDTGREGVLHQHLRWDHARRRGRARDRRSAMRETTSRKIPLVIRLTGTNEEEGREILAEAGMTPGRNDGRRCASAPWSSVRR